MPGWQLRNNCPWDRKQTHLTLIPYLRQEVNEFISSTKRKKYDEMEEELGDILLQVFFHAQIASEKKRFNIDRVFDTLIRKLIRRHPHVFGKTRLRSAEEVITKWEEIKKRERRRKRRRKR